MEVDLAFKVTEVSFDEFERRKTPRKNISLDQFQSKKNFTKKLNLLEQYMPIANVGIIVNEVPFNQFERRKVPR